MRFGVVSCRFFLFYFWCCSLPFSTYRHQPMPKVIPRGRFSAQQRVQLSMFSLSGPGCAPLVLWREVTVAITFSFTRSAASILGKVDGGGFEDNSTCTAVVSRADRACCADTSGLRQGEGESQRHDCYDP
jgi:hypothetical protein